MSCCARPAWGRDGAVLIAAALCAVGARATVCGPSIAWKDPPAALPIPGHAGAAYYPRLVRLRGGAVLCAFDGPVAGHGAVMVTRRERGSDAWSVASVASFGEGDAANAALLEVRDGVLCAYRLVNGADRSLRVSRSGDGGRTWTPLSVIATAPEGVWEPYLMAARGGVVAVYATERIRPQAIVLRSSMDGGATWGPEVVVASHAGSRDGMPVPTRLASGGIAVAFEAQDYPERPFVIRCARSGDGGRTWRGRDLVYASPRAGRKAGAPYVAALPGGALAVSFQTDEDRAESGDAHCDVKVIVSDDGGRTWGGPTAPFTGSGVTSAWASLMVDGRDVIVAGSVRRAGGAARIEVRRGTLTRAGPHEREGGRRWAIGTSACCSTPSATATCRGCATCWPRVLISSTGAGASASRRCWRR